MRQIDIIKDFTDNAKYILVKYPTKDAVDFGKIIPAKSLSELDLSKHEIHRSIENRDDNTLFVFDLKPHSDERYVDNPLQLLKSNLHDARVIEDVYPDIFRWIFDGVSIKAVAYVPSGDSKQHSTISRYGGTEMFIKILNQHLENISNMAKGKTPDYNFLNNKLIIREETLSVGSVNTFNGLYCVMIDISNGFLSILNKSKNNKNEYKPLRTIQMKYWAREINPDFISEAKHAKLRDTLDIDFEEAYKLYPDAIKNIMNLKDKGNYNRFLLARFLLSVHKPRDAKFIYESIMSPEELEHIKHGNCSTQWNYIRNNMKQYSCPTFSELSRFMSEKDRELVHPLEKIQEFMDGENDDEE